MKQSKLLLTTVLFAVAAVLPRMCYATGEAQIVEIGGVEVSFPRPLGFSTACQESALFAAAVVATTPSSSKLLTCWVETPTWEAFKSGMAQSLYPLMIVTHAPTLGNNWSQLDFEKLKSRSKEELGVSAANETQSTQLQFEEQNTTFAKLGIPIEIGNFRRSFAGIFDATETSFSYLIAREATVTVQGVSRTDRECVAITRVMYAGNLIALTVIERDTSQRSVNNAKDLSLQWRAQFLGANTRP